MKRGELKKSTKNLDLDAREMPLKWPVNRAGWDTFPNEHFSLDTGLKK